jgi:hypothetical protein
MTASTLSLPDDVHGYGNTAGRPAAGHPGRQYYDTDTDTLYQDNGTSWDTLAPGGATTGGAPDPIFDKFGTPSSAAYEFDSSSLTGWTSFGSPDEYDADTTIPDHLWLKDAASSWQFAGTSRSSISTPFTIIAKISDAWLDQNFNYAGIFVGDSSNKMWLCCLRYNSTTTRGFGGYLPTNLTDSGGGSAWSSTGVGHVDGFGYVAFVVNSTTSVDAYVSMNGMVWWKGSVAFNPSMTIAKMGLVITSGSTGGANRVAAAFDYFRVWSSALTFPGVT